LIPRRIEEKNVKIPFKNRNEIYSFKFKKKVGLFKSKFSKSPFIIFFKNKEEKIFISHKKKLHFFHTVVPIRDVFCWEVGECPKQRKKFKTKDNNVKNTYQIKKKNLIFSRAKQKWQKLRLAKSGKIWLQTKWKKTEKREILFRNSIYWIKRFKKYWQKYQMKKGNFPIYSYTRKFRLNTYKEKIEVKISNSFFLFSFKTKHSKPLKRKIWKRSFPFSKISFVPGVERQVFQKRNIGGKHYLYPHTTNSERFIGSPSWINFPRRYTSSNCIFNNIENIREPCLLFQERTRLFEKEKFNGFRMKKYLNCNDFKKERVEIVRREACWRIRNNRQWKIYPSIHSYYRPHYRIQPGELVLGRRLHPLRASYHHRYNTFSLLSNKLRNKWRKIKTIIFFSNSNIINNNFITSKKKNRFHHYQIAVHLNSSSSSILKIFNPLFHRNFVNLKRKNWRRWKSLNLPVLAKARKNWNKQNFTTIQNRNYPRKYKNNSRWWRIIRPIVIDTPGFKKNNTCLWQYSTTFFQNYEENFFAIRKNQKKFLNPAFSFSLFQINSDQRIFSIRSIKKTKKRFPANYNICRRQHIYLIRFIPFSIFFILIAKNLLINRFESVKKDFVFALYQLIRRSGRIEIEPDWIEWLLDSIGLSKQNANIRIYIKQKKEKRNLIEQIVNCNQEISIFINLLLYLRIYKQKGFFF
jgi:hypothetical protein